MTSDPLLIPIRDARRRISAECGHDPYRLVEYYKSRQEKLEAEGKRKFLTVVPSESGAAIHEQSPEYRGSDTKLE